MKNSDCAEKKYANQKTGTTVSLFEILDGISAFRIYVEFKF